MIFVALETLFEMMKEKNEKLESEISLIPVLFENMKLMVRQLLFENFDMFNWIWSGSPRREEFLRDQE